MTKPEWDTNGGRIEALEHVLIALIRQLRTQNLLNENQLSVDLEELAERMPPRSQAGEDAEDAYAEQILRVLSPDRMPDLGFLP